MELHNNPYLAGLELAKQNKGTSGQAAVAKCILSLYNPQHGFSMAEILWGLDDRYTGAIMEMVQAFAQYGESPELCMAGSYVYYHFPHLVELSDAAREAKSGVLEEWGRRSNQRQ